MAEQRIDELMQQWYDEVMNSPKLSEETKQNFAAGWLCGKMDAAERRDKAKDQK
jgi:hypothetical protein